MHIPGLAEVALTQSPHAHTGTAGDINVVDTSECATSGISASGSNNGSSVVCAQVKANADEVAPEFKSPPSMGSLGGVAVDSLSSSSSVPLPSFSVANDAWLARIDTDDDEAGPGVGAAATPALPAVAAAVAIAAELTEADAPEADATEPDEAATSASDSAAPLLALTILAAVLMAADVEVEPQFGRDDGALPLVSIIRGSMGGGNATDTEAASARSVAAAPAATDAVAAAGRANAAPSTPVPATAAEPDACNSGG